MRHPSTDVWPGDPHEVWRRAADTTAGTPFPAPPPWRDLDDFVRTVTVPRTYLGAAGLVALGGLWLGGVAVAALVQLDRHPMPDDTPWYFQAAAGPLVGLMPWSGYVALAVAVGAVGWSILHVRRGRSRRDDTVRGVHARAVAAGYVVHSGSSSLRVDTDEGTAPTRLLVDARLPEAAAARLRAATRAWLAALQGDAAATAAARARFGSRDAVPLAEIFGADAAGGWLARGPVDTARWHLVVPDGDAGAEDALDPFTLYALRHPRPAEASAAPDPTALAARDVAPPHPFG